MFILLKTNLRREEGFKGNLDSIEIRFCSSHKNLQVFNNQLKYIKICGYLLKIEEYLHHSNFLQLFCLFS